MANDVSTVLTYYQWIKYSSSLTVSLSPEKMPCRVLGKLIIYLKETTPMEVKQYTKIQNKVWQKTLLCCTQSNASSLQYFKWEFSVVKRCPGLWVNKAERQ